MALLFGQVSTLPGGESWLPPAAPPCPEFPGQQLVTATRLQFKFGLWLPPDGREDRSIFVAEPERQLACVCDTELGNFDEILREAVAGGAELKERTPAEAIAWLVRQLGNRAFERLRGGFACVIWDRDQVWLAADRFGEKRLNYAFCKDGIRFASRVRWLGDHKELNRKAIYQYLNFSFVPTPETIFEGVHKLPCGSFLHWNGLSWRKGAYWEMCYPENLADSEDVLAAELKQKFRDAIGATVNGLNPQTTGCYLSGGTDSSTVLGMMREVLGAAPAAFSIGFSEEVFSELSYARTAARRFGAEHHEYIVTAEDGWRALPHLVQAFEEPFGNPSAVGGYVCAEFAASKGIRVMLAGDGGDELFGGNERYRNDVIFSRIRTLPNVVMKNSFLDFFFRATAKSALSSRLQRILRRAALDNPERFYLEDCLSGDLNGSFLSAELCHVEKQDQPLEIVRRYYSHADAHSELNRLLFVDLKLTIGDNDLVKVRETAAACGVRVRYPMLEHGLAEFSGAMPARLKVKGLEKRYLFKRALRNFLPQAIINKKKHGFGVPVSVWFRKKPQFRELLLDTIHDPLTLQRGFFQRDRLLRIVDEHMSNCRDWGQLLWAILMLELSIRELAHEQ